MFQEFLKFFSEPLLESLPQVLVLFNISINQPHLMQGSSDDYFFTLFNIQPFQGSSNTLFYVTLFTSLISCCFGIAQFLKISPCRLYEGYGIGFVIVLFSTSFMIIYKPYLLLYMHYSCGPNICINGSYKHRHFLLILSFYLPKVIWVSALRFPKIYNCLHFSCAFMTFF